MKSYVHFSRVLQTLAVGYFLYLEPLFSSFPELTPLLTHIPSANCYFLLLHSQLRSQKSLPQNPNSGLVAPSQLLGLTPVTASEPWPWLAGLFAPQMVSA